MLRSLKEIIGYTVLANDGQIGKVHDFFFNDEAWIIRYLVVNTGFWIFGTKVLISPQALRQPVWTSRVLPVALTREQVKTSPRIDLARTVSRQYEEKLFQHYRWTGYWGMSANIHPTYVPPRLFDDTIQRGVSDDQHTTHLRSIRALLGYQVEASDGKIGSLEDFIVADDDWWLRYLVVKTSHLPQADKLVLVAVPWIEQIRVALKVVRLDLTRGSIQSSPPFDPGVPINRQFEEVLYDFHGRPKYWQVVD